MTTGVILELMKRSRRFWITGALFLFGLLAVAAWMWNPARESSDPLTPAERAWLKAHPVIRLAPDPDFPPVEYFDKSGEYRGITADYVALMEKRLGVRIRIVRLRNWDDIIRKAKSRQIDAYVATKTPQRSGYMHFTRPFLEFPVVIIAREKAKAPLSPEKLQGMKVSVVSEYAAHNFLAANYPKINLDLVPDVETGLRKVSFGLSEAFVENLATASYFIEKEGITNLRVAGESGYFYRMGFCTRKDWPELRDILEKGVAAISADEKKAIYKKWIPVEPRSLFASKEFQAAVFSALGSAVLLILAVFAWNRTLKRQVRLRTAELENELAERRRIEEELRNAREDLEQRVEERTTDLRDANEQLEREITMRKRTESVNMARLRLLQFAGTHSLEELLQATLDEAEALTGSLIGFFHFLESDQKTLSLQNWSSNTKAEFCKAEGQSRHYEVSAAGVWVDCIRERRPVIHNDYASLPHRKGLPPGHPRVTRELTVPVFRGGSIVAIVGVGNKPREYSPEDLETVSLLADLAWEITERKRAEELLQLSQFCIDKAGIGIYRSDETGAIFSVNEHACKSLGYSREELCSLNVTDIDPEITHDKMLKIKEILDETGSVTHYTTHRRRNGDTFPVEITSNNLDFRGKRYGISFVKDITERKQAEEKLRESEERLRLTLEATRIGAFEWDIRNDRFIASPTYYTMLGYEPKTGYGDRSERCACFRFHPEDEAYVNDKFAQVLTGIFDEYVYEARMLHADGSYRWQFVKGISIERDDEGKVARMLGIRMDITERKQVEEALREASLVVENSPAVLFRWKGDDEWPVELVSGNIVQFGYTPDDFLSGSFTYASIIHPDDLERVTREVHGFCDEGAGQFRLEYRIMTRGGEVRWVNEHTHIERDAAGGVKNFEGIVIDVTERKLAEDSINESRAKYQAIVDSFDGLIYISSQDNRIEFMNRKLIERTGRDAVGEYCYKVMHGLDLICPWCVNDRVFKGETVRREMHSPQDNRWYYAVNVPIRNADGSLSKHTMVIDITDRKLFEDELQRQKQLLQVLNETLESRIEDEVAKNREKDIMLIQQNRQAALGELLDHIAHQWKQPLNSISLIVQDLGETASEGELTVECAQSAICSIISLLEHMAQTIDVFRGFYRPDKEKTVFSIKDSIDQALTFISPAIRFHSVAVELDVDPALTAFGYPKEFAQVLLNILANARDVFRARGTEKPRIIIRAFAEDDMGVVTITDNAGGIPKAIIDKIFDLYFTTNKSGGGTGIGLYMSKNIVEKNLGGRLSAANVGEGAQFRIELGMHDSEPAGFSRRGDPIADSNGKEV